jgi:membrane peptidoglycan carboxypeptidase
MDCRTYFCRSSAAPFVQYVIDDVLAPMIGAQNLYDGGYSIYTTLDLTLEKKVEQITYSHLYQVTCDNYLGCYGPLDTVNNVNNAAVVVENPFNGEILAMDGSANFNDSRPQVSGRFNAATALRQPGSSFKPIVYATAFEMGWYPAMILPNHKTTYPTLISQNPLQYYSPNNYGNVYLSGFPMTIRNAIANSINIPAVDAIEFAGIKNVVNMAGRLGLTEIANKPLSQLGPSMAIGAAEVSLLHLTGAYATFADNGVRVPQTSVLEITNSQGQVLYKYDEAHPHGVQAISPEVAFLMNSILSDKTSRYHEFGPGNPLELDRPAAAKTGTTDSFRDNWTMGYTPYLAVGVWAGNSDNSLMNNVIGITGAGPIWHDVMEYALNYYNFPSADFIRPPDVQLGTVSAYTGLLPHPGEPTVTDWFINGTMPTIQGPYTPPPPPKCGDGGDGGDGCPPPQPPIPPCFPPFCFLPQG